MKHRNVRRAIVKAVRDFGHTTPRYLVELACGHRSAVSSWRFATKPAPKTAICRVCTNDRLLVAPLVVATVLLALPLALPLLAYGQDSAGQIGKEQMRFNGAASASPVRLIRLGSVAPDPASDKRWYTPLDAALDAGWIGTAVGDRLSTNYALSHCPTCYESSPVQSANVRMTISFVLVGATDYLQHRYPERRQTVRWFKVGMIGFGVWMIEHNRRLVK